MRQIGIALAAFLLLAVGCAGPQGAAPSLAGPLAPAAAEPGNPAETENKEEPEKPAGLLPEGEREPGPAGLGSGLFTDPGELNQAQQELVLQFIGRYYDSLALLQLSAPDSLFSSDGRISLMANRAVWEYLIGIRSLHSGLSLSSYHYELICQSIEEQEDGALLVRISERNQQEFSAYPDRSAGQEGLIRLFTLRREDGQWRIAGHVQFEGFYWMVAGRRGFYRPGSLDGSADTESEAAAYLLARREELLSGAREALRAREHGEGGILPFTSAYDREAAVSYARQWVGRRNADWVDYSRSGGNCQNFFSQCLLAGGIPMDIQLPGIWKWVGDNPDNQPRLAGRSASWSGVGEFMDYVQVNEGYGLVASADAPYYSGQPGDLLHLGPEEGDWRHTVIITDVITGPNGQVAGYLVHSNTADLTDFPASAYPYACQRLIKIYGSNS